MIKSPSSKSVMITLLVKYRNGGDPKLTPFDPSPPWRWPPFSTQTRPDRHSTMINFIFTFFGLKNTTMVEGLTCRAAAAYNLYIFCWLHLKADYRACLSGWPLAGLSDFDEISQVCISRPSTCVSSPPKNSDAIFWTKKKFRPHVTQGVPRGLGEEVRASRHATLF